MRVIYTVLFTLFCLISVAQKPRERNPKSISDCNPDEIFKIVEQSPTYNGGLPVIEKFLKDKLDFGEDVNGEVSIRFTVYCNGEAKDYEVLKTINQEVGDKTLKEFKKLTDWIAGVQRGWKITCQRTATFHFESGKLASAKVN